jgi:hypothetical protein
MSAPGTTEAIQRLRSANRRAHPPLNWSPYDNDSFSKNRSRQRKTLGGKMTSADSFAWLTFLGGTEFAWLA